MPSRRAGTSAVSYTAALLLVAVYAGVGLAIAGTLFQRRDGAIILLDNQGATSSSLTLAEVLSVVLTLVLPL